MAARVLNIYWAVMAITCLFAMIFRDDRKYFVISAAIVHIFVCGFRYEFAGCDLRSYQGTFWNCVGYGWNDPRLLKEGRNTLFFVFNKVVAVLSGNSFQVLLFSIALISIVSISIVIYRYSHMPLISYLMWSCFGFYVFSFSGIKQTLAMAFVMFASIGIFERKRWLFYIMAILAGFVHMPAFVFLPAYELCRAKKMSSIIRFYIIMVVFILIFRNRIVSSMSELYYEGGKYEAVSAYGIGGKTIMMMGLLAVGLFLCSAEVENFRIVFILMATASIVQIFSVYDNVFTRLSDYYFQFIILYAPFILKQPHNSNSDIAVMYFNKESRLLLTIGFTLMALVFYYKVYFVNSTIPGVVEMIGEYKFFWQ